MPQASIPSPRTWSSGDFVLVPRLRADVTDAAAFLLARPYFVGQVSTGPAVATGTVTGLTMDAELTDSWNAHLAPGVSFYAPVPGWYLADVRIPWFYTSGTAAPFYCGFQGLTNGASFGPVYAGASVNGSGGAPDLALC